MTLSLFYIFTAKYLFVSSFIIGGIYFLQQPRVHQKKILLFGTVSVILIYMLAIVAGQLYNNPRPFVVGHFAPLIPHSPDNGFPSDHVLLVSAIASILTYFANRRVIISLWFITVLIAISRVYVGVHHPIDVIASTLISIGGTYVVWLTLTYHNKI